MDRIPKTIPISDLRFDQTAVLDGLADGPVLLTRQGRPAAVLVAPEAWNKLLDALEDQSDVIMILKQELEEERGEEAAKLVEVDTDELKAWADEAMAA